MNKEIHELLKIKNNGTTIFTNKELKMIDDYTYEDIINTILSKYEEIIGGKYERNIDK